jgi:hypothetical protein
MNSYFDCDNILDLKEYVGCKIDKQERGNCLLITQPVIVRSFMDELNFLRELKENGIIEVDWIKSEDNVADILTKIYRLICTRNM